MDPNAAVDMILDAIENADFAAVVERLEELHGWSAKDGFPPSNEHLAKLWKALADTFNQPAEGEEEEGDDEEFCDCGDECECDPCEHETCGQCGFCSCCCAC